VREVKTGKDFCSHFWPAMKKEFKSNKNRAFSEIPDFEICV